jgi:hypothetical protein
VAGVACVLALLRSFGLHLLWLPYHFESARTALTEVECLSPNRDELFVQCAFGGIVFEIPESMAKNISIGRSGSDVWIRFADATRMVGIEFPRHKDTATYLMPIPDGMDDWSLPRLWKEMCDCSSDNFSWKQSREDLRRLHWAIMGRRELGLDRNNFTRYSFEANRGCEWILLSCDPAAVDHKTRLRSWMIWETQNANAGGEIHFGDAARQKVAWIDVFARSFQMTTLPATGNSMIDIADKTSSEILSMISIDQGSGENESR